MTTDMLKEYLKRVYTLEKSIYEQNQIVYGLKKKIKLYNRGEYFGENSPFVYFKEEEKKPEFGDYFSLFELFFLGMMISLIFGAIAWFCLYIALVANKSFRTFMRSISLAGYGGGDAAVILVFLMFVIICIIYTLRAVISYNKEKKRISYNNMIIASNNQDIQNYNASLLKDRIRKKEILQREVNRLNTSMHQTAQMLKQYYQLGVIFPKYRNIIAVSSFYEYLLSGRCNMLTGHEGAYNIFENEIRLNRIITQLDMVIEKIDRIRDTQFELYLAISESNKKANQIISQLTAVKNNSDRIAYNTEISSYNSQIIAQNSEYMKWLTILRS